MSGCVRGKQFYRLVQQAVAFQPAPFSQLVVQPDHKAQGLLESSGYLTYF